MIILFTNEVWLMNENVHTVRLIDFVCEVAFLCKKYLLLHLMTWLIRHLPHLPIFLKIYNDALIHRWLLAMFQTQCLEYSYKITIYSTLYE